VGVCVGVCVCVTERVCVCVAIMRRLLSSSSRRIRVLGVCVRERDRVCMCDHHETSVILLSRRTSGWVCVWVCVVVWVCVRENLCV